MKITKEYLKQHRTTKGAFTKGQLSNLGIAWPPPAKWQSLIIGKVITEEEAALFEEAKNIKADNKRKKYKKSK